MAIPVTTAELERCFSTLNRIKSFLESAMGERESCPVQLIAADRHQHSHSWFQAPSEPMTKFLFGLVFLKRGHIAAS